MFEGFGIEYLFGATAFGIFNLVSLFMLLGAAILIWCVFIYVSNNGEVTLNDFRYAAAGFITGIVIIGLLVPSMIVQPRVVISVPPNSALIEHQAQDGDIVIITPPNRVEYLDGFRPLGEE